MTFVLVSVVCPFSAQPVSLTIRALRCICMSNTDHHVGFGSLRPAMFLVLCMVHCQA